MRSCWLCGSEIEDNRFCFRCGFDNIDIDRDIVIPHTFDKIEVVEEKENVKPYKDHPPGWLYSVLAAVSFMGFNLFLFFYIIIIT
ncbi:MAG: hypothetical protein DRI44_02535 [Chlamydiae bacterium]|nr:MAG: hypothetical protein DRI44_02535 [Chlamydiota bacterium]